MTGNRFRCVCCNLISIVFVDHFSERPEPPSDIWVGDHGSRTAQIAWVKSYHGNSPVTGYIVQYKLATGKITFVNINNIDEFSIY